MQQTFIIEKGESYRVTAANNDVAVWDITDNKQPSLVEEISKGYSWVFGPFTSPQKYGVTYDQIGSVTIEKLLVSPPIILSAVADATDTDDIVTQFNALLTVLRTANVLGEAPENTEAPEITGTSQAGEVLTCSSGEWESSQPIISYSYVWKLASDDSAIDGATNSTFELTADEVGDAVYCVVTALNRFGSTSATSEDTETVIEE